MEKLNDEKNELSAVEGGVMHGTASREWRRRTTSRSPLICGESGAPVKMRRNKL